MVTAAELVDEAWALYHELDDALPMWEADVDQIERWMSTSSAHTAAVRERCAELSARLRAAAAGAPVGDAVSLLTAAGGMDHLHGTADVAAELTVGHPTQGVLSMLHWAIPGYSLRTEEHGERFHDKLRRAPAAVDELRGRLEEAAASDRVMLARHAAESVAMIDELLASAVADDPLMAQAPPSELDDDGAARFRDGVAELVSSHVRPALGRLRDTLATHVQPRGRDDDHPGLVHFPGGEQAYAESLAAFTEPGTTSDDVHRWGWEQLERLDEEWAALGQEQYATSDPVEVRRRVAEMSGRATADEVVRDATAVHERATAAAPEWFLRIPDAPCVAKAVEHGSLAFYNPPSPDGVRPGTMFYNVVDPTVWRAQLAAVVVHEGVPGHHYQIALALEDDDLHEIHKKMFLNAFGEGWALYAERVADEMGVFPDTISRLGMLSSDAMRAARMVVDTGLHALGWTRQQAIDTMVEATGLGVVECTAEIDRYIGIPGQATGYMVGRLAIDRLRADASRRLGDRFDIAGFHGAVLANGMVSLDALEVQVEDWVTTTAR